MTQQQHRTHNAPAAKSEHSMPEQLREEVQMLAYELYCRCGHEHGHDLEHWVEAERRVLERHRGQSKKGR